jgi:predicted MPP superfamily phosphohydrolase
MARPLTPDTPQSERKARVAELSDLWYKSLFSVPVMINLLDERRKEVAYK